MSRRTVGFICGVATAMLVAAGVATASFASSPSSSGANAGSIAAAAAPFTCGAWGSSQSSTDPTVTQFLSSYGGIAKCGLTGDSWVIATAGKPANAAQLAQSEASPDVPMPPGTTWSQDPGLAVYRCPRGNLSCLSPSASHVFANWKYASAPVAGSITLLGNPYPGVIVVDISGYQEIFDTNTLSWTTVPSASFGACATSWGSMGGSSSSPTAKQEQFLSANPQCLGAP